MCFMFMSLSAAATAPPTTTTAATIGYCPKCGIKKTGKASCCAPNGAWYKKCGNEGDPKYEHTWLEGVEACCKCVVNLVYAHRTLNSVWYSLCVCLRFTFASIYSGHHDDPFMPQMRHQEIWQTQLLRSRRRLV